MWYDNAISPTGESYLQRIKPLMLQYSGEKLYQELGKVNAEMVASGGTGNIQPTYDEGNIIAYLANKQGLGNLNADYKEITGTDLYVLNQNGYPKNFSNVVHVKSLTNKSNGHYGENGNDVLITRYPNGTALGQSTGQSDLMYGGKGDDTITGSNGRDLLIGREGNDIIKGLDGEDTLGGNSGDDTIEGGDGIDKLYGGMGNDKLDGGDKNDELYGGDDYDELKGGNGDDLLVGEKGVDLLEGGAGDDTLDGGDDDDVLDGGSDSDTLYGGYGNDILNGGEGADRLCGESGDDILYGGHSIANGYDGNAQNRLYGDDGNDTLYGSGYLEGGKDFDTYFAYDTAVIKDEDGLGKVHIDLDGSPILLTGGTHKLGASSNIYESADGKITYTWDKQAHTLKINDKLTITDWENGQLGIKLTTGHDIAFIIDVSGSMDDDILAVVNEVNRITNALFDSTETAKDNRVAIATYETNTTILQSFTDQNTVASKIATFNQAVAKLPNMVGGGIENVYHAIYDVLKGRAGQWREDATTSTIFVIGDEPGDD